MNERRPLALGETLTVDDGSAIGYGVFVDGKEVADVVRVRAIQGASNYATGKVEIETYVRNDDGMFRIDDALKELVRETLAVDANRVAVQQGFYANA